MTAKFIDFLDLRALPDGVRFVVLDTFRYRSASGIVYTVPRGFITDLTSTPRPLWGVFPPTGRYEFAAVLHDWLYWSQSVTRAEADALLLEAMAVCGVSWIDRHAIYAGVRLGGGKAWADNAVDRGLGHVRVVTLDPVLATTPNLIAAAAAKPDRPTQSEVMAA